MSGPRMGAMLALAAVLVLAVAVAVSVAVVDRWRAAVLGAIPMHLRLAARAWVEGVTVDHALALRMPDGARLATSLYLPRTRPGPLPTVLLRTPYDRLRDASAATSALMFAAHGYAVLVQDLRGTGGSEGELLPWQGAGEDGARTLDWIVAQPWSNGRVGTFGCSALGETQFPLARLNHPAHRAMIAAGAGGAIGSLDGRHGYFGVFEGGVPQLASAFGWFVANGATRPDAAPAVPFDTARHLRHLPVSELVQRVRPAPNGFSSFLATPPGDARWHERGYWSDSDRSTVPALIINSWGDQTLGDTLALAQRWQQHGVPQKVIIAPGNHCQHKQGGRAGPATFGELAIEGGGRPWDEWAKRWFDHWLAGRGDALAELPPYQFFMLNENRWLGSDTWPPAEAKAMRWHLASDGRANGRAGNGRLVPQPQTADTAGAPWDEFRYDPADPVPSRGGPLCCTGNPADRSGPVDQADVETRDDVLVYTSAPLADDLRIAGPVAARLRFSSSAPDTDLVVRLVHVWPDGRATNIQEGALRLRYREGIDRPRLLVPGEPVDASVDMRAIAYTVPRGHRLRLHVTSSSFPRLERNLNTGAPNNSAATDMAVAVNRVHHAGDAPSWVELRVLPPQPAQSPHPPR